METNLNSDRLLNSVHDYSTRNGEFRKHKQTAYDSGKNCAKYRELCAWFIILSAIINDSSLSNGNFLARFLRYHLRYYISGFSALPLAYDCYQFHWLDYTNYEKFRSLHRTNYGEIITIKRASNVKIFAASATISSRLRIVWVTNLFYQFYTIENDEISTSINLALHSLLK